MIFNLQPFQIAIIIASFFVSFGILSRKLIGYYSFLTFSGIMIVYNLWLMILFYFGNSFNIAGHPVSGDELWGNFFLTSFLLIAVFYFLNKEISAPYFSSEPRGWRKDPRETVPIPFSLEWNGNTWTGNTLNISTSGAMAPINGDIAIQEGDESSLKVDIENKSGEKFSPVFRSVVVRVGTNPDLPGDCQLGLRFLSSGDFSLNQELLNFYLNERYSPRYKVDSKILFGNNDATESEGKIGNISEDGVYIETDQVRDNGDPIHMRIPTTPPFSLEGRVSWVNRQGQFGKKPGFGVQFIKSRNGLRFRFWLLKIRILQFKTR